MITLARQVQLKLKKFDEVMIKLKTKYIDNPSLYSELHKLDEKKEEIDRPDHTFLSQSDVHRK